MSSLFIIPDSLCSSSFSSHCVTMKRFTNYYIIPIYNKQNIAMDNSQVITKIH